MDSILQKRYLSFKLASELSDFGYKVLAVVAVTRSKSRTRVTKYRQD